MILLVIVLTLLAIAIALTFDIATEIQAKQMQREWEHLFPGHCGYCAYFQSMRQRGAWNDETPTHECPDDIRRLAEAESYGYDCGYRNGLRDGDSEPKE